MKLKALFLALMCLPTIALAEVGVNVGIGVPFIGQAGVNYQINEQFRLGATFNMLDLKVDDAQAKLVMPEVYFTYHPFSGSFFIGGGVGQEKLDVSATDQTGANEVSAEVKATTAIGKIGWMWGAADGGFWFGMDLSYIKPMSPKNTLTVPAGVPTTDPNYQDVVDAMDKFGDTAYVNITFARLGYFF